MYVLLPTYTSRNYVLLPVYFQKLDVFTSCILLETMYFLPFMRPETMYLLPVYFQKQNIYFLYTSRNCVFIFCILLVTMYVFTSSLLIEIMYYLLHVRLETMFLLSLYFQKLCITSLALLETMYYFPYTASNYVFLTFSILLETIYYLKRIRPGTMYECKSCILRVETKCIVFCHCLGLQASLTQAQIRNVIFSSLPPGPSPARHPPFPQTRTCSLPYSFS